MRFKIIFILIVSLIYTYCIFTFARFYLADVNFMWSEKQLANGNTIEALNSANKSILYNPNEPAYYKQRAKTYIVAAGLSSEQTVQNSMKENGLNDLLHAHYLNPMNLATIRNTAPLYFFLAYKDLRVSEKAQNIDEKYVDISREYFKQMQNYLPNDLGVQIVAFKYQKRLGLDQEAQETYERIKTLRPEIVTWHPDLVE